MRFSDYPAVFTTKIDRPYFEAWLRRTGKQFAVSGRLTQTAMLLAAEDGGSVDEWRTRLRILLEGNEVPSLDLLTKIDMLLAGPTRRRPSDDGQFSFFLILKDTRWLHCYKNPQFRHSRCFCLHLSLADINKFLQFFQPSLRITQVHGESDG